MTNRQGVSKIALWETDERDYYGSFNVWVQLESSVADNGDGTCTVELHYPSGRHYPSGAPFSHLDLAFSDGTSERVDFTRANEWTAEVTFDCSAPQPIFIDGGEGQDTYNELRLRVYYREPVVTCVEPSSPDTWPAPGVSEEYFPFFLEFDGVEHQSRRPGSIGRLTAPGAAGEFRPTSAFVRRGSYCLESIDRLWSLGSGWGEWDVVTSLDVRDNGDGTCTVSFNLVHMSHNPYESTETSTSPGPLELGFGSGDKRETITLDSQQPSGSIVVDCRTPQELFLTDFNHNDINQVVTNYPEVVLCLGQPSTESGWR